MTRLREVDNVKVYLLSVVKMWVGYWFQLAHDGVFANTVMKVWEFIVCKRGGGALNS